MKIESVALYRVSCHRCSFNAETRTAAVAEVIADLHEQDHLRTANLGKALTGLVRPDVDLPSGMHIGDAAKEAQRGGWSFFAFNGRVYPSAGGDWVCLTAEVPEGSYG